MEYSSSKLRFQLHCFLIDSEKIKSGRYFETYLHVLKKMSYYPMYVDSYKTLQVSSFFSNISVSVRKAQFQQVLFSQWFRNLLTQSRVWCGKYCRILNSIFQKSFFVFSNHTEIIAHKSSPVLAILFRQAGRYHRFSADFTPSIPRHICFILR